MAQRILDPVSLLAILGCGVVAAIIAAIVARGRGQAVQELMVETGILAAAGAFIARTFIVIVLDLLDDSSEAQVLVGWAFFLWPGAIDTVAAIFGGQLVTTPDRLAAIAIAVGAVSGLFDGLHRVRPWPWPGVVTFLVDETWALVGTTNGCLLHLIDMFGRTHAADGRSDAHQYTGGFHLKPTYAFTQGAVMSTLPDAPGTPLYAHERNHVFEVRVFGPFYTLSYILWAVVLFVPAVAAAITKSAHKAEVIEAWCYYDNPWEAWSYKIQERRGGGSRTAFGTYVWSDRTVVITAVVFYVLVAIVSLIVIGWVLP